MLTAASKRFAYEFDALAQTLTIRYRGCGVDGKVAHVLACSGRPAARALILGNEASMGHFATPVAFATGWDAAAVDLVLVP